MITIKELKDFINAIPEDKLNVECGLIPNLSDYFFFHYPNNKVIFTRKHSIETVGTRFYSNLYHKDLRIIEIDPVSMEVWLEEADGLAP